MSKRADFSDATCPECIKSAIAEMRANIRREGKRLGVLEALRPIESRLARKARKPNE